MTQLMVPSLHEISEHLTPDPETPANLGVMASVLDQSV